MDDKIKNRKKCRKWYHLHAEQERKRSKEKYARNRVYRRKYAKKIYPINRKILQDLKSNGCAICGYSKCFSALDFHHVNPENKKFNIAISRLGRKDFVEELEKCILLCSNCHKEIHEKERRYEK